MVPLRTIATTVLGVLAAIATGLILLVGLVMAIAGLYGLVVGMHGGSVAAVITAALGAGLSFIGVFTLRVSVETLRGNSAPSEKAL